MGPCWSRPGPYHPPTPTLRRTRPACCHASPRLTTRVPLCGPHPVPPHPTRSTPSNSLTSQLCMQCGKMACEVADEEAVRALLVRATGKAGQGAGGRPCRRPTQCIGRQAARQERGLGSSRRPQAQALHLACPTLAQGRPPARPPTNEQTGGVHVHVHDACMRVMVSACPRCMWGAEVEAAWARAEPPAAGGQRRCNPTCHACSPMPQRGLGVVPPTCAAGAAAPASS